MAPKIAGLITEILSDTHSTKRLILVFTGHSAGGAVAFILYAHMLKATIPNDLHLLWTASQHVTV